MQNKKIAVFGATGKIGLELIRLLSLAKIDTVAVTRNLRRAVPHPYIEWIEADIAHKNSLHAAMKNCSAVFLLSGNSPDFIKEQKNVISTAKELNIQYIVKLSSGAADKNAHFFIPKTHGIVEDFLIRSGIHYTMLRPNGIMQNWLGDIANSVRKERRFHESTGDGKRAHVDARDVSAVAFACLTNPAKHYDKIYLLTSDRALNYYDVAEAISKAIDEEVRYIPISLQQAREEMERQGMPAALVDTFISYDAAQRNGETQIVTDCVRMILEKPALTVEQFAKDYATHFQ
ncbi:MAG: NAD(P)H-binding protein [Filimonas sp.]|nr:NAD(P)H-binding protein [Filimonas sp.]